MRRFTALPLLAQCCDRKGQTVARALAGDNDVEFHKPPEFQHVTLKVLRREERDKRLVIKEAQMVA